MTDCSSNLNAKFNLKPPTLQQLQSVLQSGLQSSFAEVEVKVINCPDLSVAPFNLVAPGLGSLSSVRIAEVGGPGNLLPATHKSKKFNLRTIAETCELPKAFLLGPGAGPWPIVGCNCEMIANCSFKGESPCIGSKIAKIIPETNKYQQENIDSIEFSLMANLLVSDGECGEVIYVKVKQRIAPTNFPGSIRKVLEDHYGNRCISLGGVFVMKTGKAKLHVMPDFPRKQLSDDREVTKWLKFFEMEAPLVCASVIHSSDPGYSLRLEHTHCYSDHGDAGHYHYDTTGALVEYEGYFVPANCLYRIDQV